MFENDRQLVTAVVRGDPGAADEFMARYGAMIWRVLTRTMRLAPDRAADVFQELMLRLFQYRCRVLESWRGDSSLATWLLVVTRRFALDVLRAEKRRPDADHGEPTASADPPSGDPSPEDAAMLAERAAALDACRALLGPADRRLIELRHDRGLAYAAIADEMGWTVNHVGVALGRAERRLADLLRQHHPGLFEEARPHDVM